MTEGSYIVKINNLCNSNCIFCADAEEIRKKEDFSYLELEKKLIEKRKEFSSLIISGGEPTIYPKLPEYIKKAKDLGYHHIALTTNGFMLAYKDYLKKLVENGLNYIILSFQTTDSLAYSSITRIKNAYEIIKRSIANINELKVPVTANVVIHKLNYKQIPQIVDYLIINEFKSIQLTLLNPIDETYKKSKDKKSKIALSIKEIKPFIEKAFSISQRRTYDGLYLENFPFCTMMEFKDKITDLKTPEENKEYYNASKEKPKKCLSCGRYNICNGTWKEYLLQQGKEELKPIKTSLQEMFNYPKEFNEGLFHSYFSDIIALLSGQKKVSSFQSTKPRLEKLVETFKIKDFKTQISDYAYIDSNGAKFFNENIPKEAIYTLFVSKDESLLKELAELEKNAIFGGKTSVERIGELYGYPKCCVKAYVESISGDKNKGVDGGMAYDLYHRKTTLDASKEIFHQLNNFTNKIPSHIGFFPCSYNCKEAKAYVGSMMESAKEFGINTLQIKEISAVPLIFRSIHESIVLESYSEGAYKVLEFGSKEEEKFLKGDSLKITSERIDIFKNKQKIVSINKENPLNGIIVEFK